MDALQILVLGIVVLGGVVTGLCMYLERYLPPETKEEMVSGVRQYFTAEPVEVQPTAEIIPFKQAA